MSPPFTTVTMTYNLWGRHEWPQREPALRALFATRDADIIAVQELCTETREVLDEVLPSHTRVHDESPGWAEASNIWWNRDLYRLDAHGAEDIGLRKQPRRLFWVRLIPLQAEASGPLLFATAHFTWPGDPQEELDAVNPRIGQATETVKVLDRLAPDGPCMFVGDLNEFHHPVRILRRAGFKESFGALGSQSPATCPVAPLDRPQGEGLPLDVPRVIDFQFHRGPIRVRGSEVVDFFLGQIAPSDHKPVVVTYTLT